MIQKLDTATCRKMHVALVADNAYVMVYEALKDLNPEKTKMHHVEIWLTALELTSQLTESPAPEEILEVMMEQLQEETTGVHDAELIATTCVCQLAARRKQIDNVDNIVKMLMPYCKKNPDFYPLLEKIDGKEQRMLQMGKKVDALTHAFTIVKDEGVQKAVELFTGYINMAVTLTPSTMESSLLAFNLFNIQSGHIFDELIMSVYEKYIERIAPGTRIEMILGNKNVAENGGVQLNTAQPVLPSGNEFIQMLSNLKQLK